MTDMKQPEALRLAQFCRAIARGLRVRPYIEDLNAAAALLAHQYTEITELRAKLDELENQGPMSITGAQVLDALDELDASARGDEPYNHFAAPLIRGYVESTIAAGARPVEPVQKLRPDFIAGYDAGMADAKRIQAAQPAPGAGDQVQMILKHRLIRKVEGDWLAASEFMTGEPDPSWLAKTEESPEEWRIEQARRVSGEQIQAGLTRAFASWKKPAPAAQDDAERCVRLRALLLNSFGLDVNESPQEVEQTDALFRDAARYRWLTDDHERQATRIVRNAICERLPVMSYSAASANIDAARAADKKEPT